MACEGSQIAVTVVVAAYNAENTIAASLRSALDDNDVALEVIVVDDASIDGTARVVESLAQSDTRLRLIRAGKNGGPGAARNIAIDQAKGEWIAILDADDRFHSDRLSTLLAVAREWQADMVADNLWLVDGSSGRPFDLMLRAENINSPKEVSAEEFVRNNQPINVKRKYGLLKPIIRRDLLDRHAIRYEEGAPYGEDILFYVECLARGAKFVLVPEAYYFYELSRAQMTRTGSVSKAEAFITYCDRLSKRDDIQAVPGLARALGDWTEQLRANLAYLRFRRAFTDGRPIEAFGVLASRPDLLSYFALHIRRAAVLRLRQFFGGLGARRAAARAADPA